MIGRLCGLLAHRGPDHVLIDVGGVGYVVHVSDGTLARLPPVGATVTLHTDLLVREDLLQLFGFPSPVEKEWHRVLTTVQGVGAKVALGLTGTLGAEGLARAIALGDWAALRAAPGVGPKLAQRIANELKARAPALMAEGAAPVDARPTPSPAAAATGPSPASAPAAASAEALSALGNLGYGPGEAAAAVAEAARADPEAGTAALIRAALRLLAPKG